NPFATDDDFAEFGEGLVCLTGGEEGPVAQIFRQSERKNATGFARVKLTSLVRIFGSNGVFVELQRHYRRDQEARNQALVDLAGSLNLPLLATNGVAYATPERRELQD